MEELSKEVEKDEIPSKNLSERQREGKIEGEQKEMEQQDGKSEEVQLKVCPNVRLPSNCSQFMLNDRMPTVMRKMKLINK